MKKSIKKKLKNKKSNLLLKFKIVSIFLILLLYIINIRLHHNGNKNKIFTSLLAKKTQNTKPKFKIIAISYSNNIYQRQLKFKFFIYVK